jgi:hypothetical protein
MPRVGFDYSWSRPSAAALQQHGAVFVCRYLSNDASKNLTPDEAQQLLASGIAIVCNWESTASRANDGGFGGGISDAQAALAQAQACGMPDDRPIYFSVDEDTTVGPKITAYFHGVQSVLGYDRTGAYGSYTVIQQLLDAGLVKWAWQTYAWSGGQWDDRAHIRQIQNGLKVGTADVDMNEAMVDDFGQWPAPVHDDPHTTGEFTMDADAKNALDALSDKLGQIGAILENGTVTGKPDGHVGLRQLDAKVSQLQRDVAAIAAKLDV